MILAPLLTLAASSSAPAFDPAWEFAYERGGNLYVSRADGAKSKLVAKNASGARWSHDGARLAYYAGSKIWVFDFGSGKARAAASVKSPDPEETYDLDWDPFQPALLYGISSQHALSVVNLRSGESWQILGRWGFYTYAPRWSPSGSLLAFARNGDVWLAQRDLKERTRGIAPERNEYYDAANRLAALAVFNDTEVGASIATPFWVDDLEWTSDERKLVFHFQRVGGSGVSEIGYLDLKKAAGTTWETSSGYSATTHWVIKSGMAPRVCPDGRTLSYVSLGNGQDLYVCSWDGKSKRRVMKDVWNPAWRPRRGR